MYVLYIILVRTLGLSTLRYIIYYIYVLLFHILFLFFNYILYGHRRVLFGATLVSGVTAAIVSKTPTTTTETA